MKNNYIIAIFVFLLSIQLGNAQECPYEIGNSATLTDPHFKIVPATCADYPNMITIDGSTFTKVNCNGSNLFYTLDAGQTPLSSADSFVADFGFAICTYVNSQLQTLSVDRFTHPINSLRVYPNPLKGSDQLSVHFDKNVSAQLNIYDLTGKRVISKDIENSSAEQVNVSSLNNGVYMLQIVADSTSTSRKIVVMK